MRQTHENWKQLGDEIERMVRRIQRLCPDHRAPNRFHEETNGVAQERKRVAKRMDR